MGIAPNTAESLAGDPRRSRLIETIYSTVADPDAWPIFLRELVTRTDSRSARLLVMNAQATRVLSSFKLNIDDHCHSQYVEHFVNTCPWRPELRHKAPGRLYSTYLVNTCPWRPELRNKAPGRLYSTYLHFSCRQPDYLRSEFYNDWAKAQDIHHGVCGTIYRDAGRTVQLLVQRTQGQGHYTEEDTAFFNGMVPHLQHSLLLAGQVADRRARAEAIAVAAAGEALPFFLLDFSLRPTYSNPGAEGLLGSETPLTLVNGQLRLVDRGRNQQLQRLLRECLVAAESRAFHAAGGLVEVPRPGVASLQLLVRPIHPDVPVLAGRQAGYVAVYVYDPAAQLAMDQDRLRTLYALSEAEIRVALALLASPDPAAVAQRCCISLHTVRSHLKAIFAKTETQSQADLVKCLLAGPARRR